MLLPALFAGELFAFFHLLQRVDLRALLRNLGFDEVDFVADVHAIGHGFFVAVVTDDIAFEKAVRAVIRGSGQPNQAGIKVIKHLLPHVVYRTVAFVDKNKVKKFRRHFVVVNHRHWDFGLHHFSRVNLLGGIVQRRALQDGVEPLYGADANLTVLGDIRGLEPLHVVKLGELAVIVYRHIGHHFLLGLLAKVFCIHQKQDAFSLCVFQQAINGRDGRVCLARTGCHLNQGAWSIRLERCLQIENGGFLTIAQPQFVCGLSIWIKWR